MARIRTVKPEFWQSETIASLSIHARLLFICTLNLADDEGLLRWNAPFLKSSAFLYDDEILTESVSEYMDELVIAELILPYTGGKLNAKYGWIITFHEHQKINRPSPSRLPNPSLKNADVRKAYAHRDNMICQISGNQIMSYIERHRGDKESLSLDHIKPISKGGTDYPSNIRATIQKANKGRGNKTDNSDSSECNDTLNDLGSDSFSESFSDGREREEEKKGKEHETPAAIAKTDYAFSGETIKLNQEDFDKASELFPNLNLSKELKQIDFELRGDKKWFASMNMKLNYRNKQAQGRPSLQVVNGYDHDDRGII